MKKLLFLILFLPLLSVAQEDTTARRYEYLTYDGSKFIVTTSRGKGYIDEGYGLRRQFDSNMQILSYLSSLGWKMETAVYNVGQPSLRYSRPLQYVFSKDVTGWSEEAIANFVDKLRLTDDIRCKEQIYSKRERKRFDAKAKELGIDPIQWP